jgi:putative ABC transport system permease protein
MVISATGGAVSLRRVIDEPARFGASWDAIVGREEGEDAAERLRTLSGVRGAARISGTDVTIGDDPEVWVQVTQPVEGIDFVGPVIVAGRAPASDGEIALGSVTMEKAGVRMGQSVSLTSKSSPSPAEFRVVGEAMVTDGYEPNVGDGGLVSREGMERIEAEALDEADLAIAMVRGPNREAALAGLRAEFPGAVIPFPVPASLANAERISGLPLYLAFGAAAIAAFTLAHALLVSIRRNRRELAVCRVLGFTRPQVRAAVAVQATTLGTLACVLGVLAGVIGALWGWRLLAGAFGVSSGPVIPMWIVIASTGAALLLANLAAAPSVRSASRLRPTEVLRAE